MQNVQTGDKVICNGYPGVVIRRYSGHMVEVRLDRGGVCVDESELLPRAEEPKT